MKRDPFERVADAAATYIRDEVMSRVDDARGDSPIEKLFFVALAAHVRVNTTEFEHLMVPEDEAMRNRLMAEDRLHIYRRALIVEPQKQVGGWRVDFLIHRYDEGWPDRPKGWTAAIVECDGHNFHERTKEQAAKDRSRDRDAQLAGYQVFRFTGSELWRDAWGCARQFLEWAQKGV